MDQLCLVIQKQEDIISDDPFSFQFTMNCALYQEILRDKLSVCESKFKDIWAMKQDSGTKQKRKSISKMLKRFFGFGLVLSKFWLKAIWDAVAGPWKGDSCLKSASALV